MHSTLSSLVERAFMGNQRPLEFYLREQSRLPGPRANLELVHQLSSLLAALAAEQPDHVRSLLNYLISIDREKVKSNTPAEFVLLCGVVASGACAAVQAKWRGETFELLEDSASSTLWRVREGVALAFQKLLPAASYETSNFLVMMATRGNCYQQRAAIAAIAEPLLLHKPDMVEVALTIQ